MDLRIEQSWKELLKDEFELPYFKALVEFVKDEYNTQIVYPPAERIFRCFDLCPLDKVKLVIIGQDPYHGANQANGLCFSVNKGEKLPPSLRNIYKELSEDLGTPLRTDGDLAQWAEQGVLLLNASLTVRDSTAGSHQKKGWETFTDAVIRELSAKKEKLVYILWGSYAQKKGANIDANRNLILTSVHPSPLSASRGFFGNKQFSRANEYLGKHGIAPIEW
ncbi:MAG: uracil-DNA glycosylase [Bacteroidales bacterium]